jgi:hypothetical protein
MVMVWQDAALATAGVIGSSVAIFHGILTQRLIVRPVEALIEADTGMARPIRRLVPLLLQYSTFNWLLGGFALIAAALWFGHDARLATGLLVGSSYLYGAAGNLWGTRGRHPGWMLMAVALVLIVLGVDKSGG